MKRIRLWNLAVKPSVLAMGGVIEKLWTVAIDNHGDD